MHVYKLSLVGMGLPEKYKEKLDHDFSVLV